MVIGKNVYKARFECDCIECHDNRFTENDVIEGATKEDTFVEARMRGWFVDEFGTRCFAPGHIHETYKR